MFNDDLIAYLQPAPNRFHPHEWRDVTGAINDIRVEPHRFTLRASLPPGLYRGRIETKAGAFDMTTAMVEMVRVPDGKRVLVGPWDLDHIHNVMAMTGPEQIAEGRLGADFGFEAEEGQTELTLEFVEHDRLRMDWGQIRYLEFRKDNRKLCPLSPKSKRHHRVYVNANELAGLRKRWLPDARFQAIVEKLKFGDMGFGVIEAVGSAITNFKVGDAVYYRANDSMELANGHQVSSVCGTHCSHVVTRANADHGVAPMFPGAAMDAACLFVMPAVGLYGVDMANPRMGQTVVVHGCGLIGLGVVAACAHRGCVVIAVDVNSKQLNMARQMGADFLINGSQQDVKAEVMKIAPNGADVVFESTGLPACIDPAIELCRLDGSFVWQGNYGSAPISMKFMPPHGRRLRMFFPCDDGLQPCRRAVVKNMAMGALKWEQVITHRIEYPEAPSLFARINHGDKEIIGAVIHWAS